MLILYSISDSSLFSVISSISLSKTFIVSSNDIRVSSCCLFVFIIKLELLVNLYSSFKYLFNVEFFHVNSNSSSFSSSTFISSFSIFIGYFPMLCSLIILVVYFSVSSS